MGRSKPRLLLFAAELLLAGPPAVIAIYWAVVICAGFSGRWDLALHRPEIAATAGFLVAGALACLLLSGLLFLFSPRRSRD